MFQVCKLDVQSSSSRSFTAILTDCNPTRQSNFWIEPYKNKAMCIHKEVVIVFSIFTLDMYMLFTISISHTRARRYKSRKQHKNKQHPFSKLQIALYTCILTSSFHEAQAMGIQGNRTLLALSQTSMPHYPCFPTEIINTIKNHHIWN